MRHMRRRGFLEASLTAIGTPMLARAAQAADAPADLIVSAQTIHTVETANPTVTAFAVRNGRFVYAGSLDGALALRGSKTEVVDFGSATILPGLVDAHMHLTAVGQALHEVDLYHVTSFDEIVRRTVAFAK